MGSTQQTQRGSLGETSSTGGHFGAGTCTPWAAQRSLSVGTHAYEQNRHRIYSLAFWMTDNELAAAALTEDVLQQTVLLGSQVSTDVVDRIFLGEIRELMPVGQLTLRCAPATQVLNVRRNTMRVHLERAVVQLPPTERLIFLLHEVEGYGHEKIARLLKLKVEACVSGLHQARLRVRELLAAMIG